MKWFFRESSISPNRNGNVFFRTPLNINTAIAADTIETPRQIAGLGDPND